MIGCFFFNDTATTEIYTLSLHDALPIYSAAVQDCVRGAVSLNGERLLDVEVAGVAVILVGRAAQREDTIYARSEEHTSELQSRQYLVCRLLLEKKKKPNLSPPHRLPEHK